MGKKNKKQNNRDFDPSIFDDPVKMDAYFAALAAAGELGDVPTVKTDVVVEQKPTAHQQTSSPNPKDVMDSAVNNAVRKFSEAASSMVNAADRAITAAKTPIAKRNQDVSTNTTQHQTTPSVKEQMSDIYNIGSFMRVSVAESRGVKYISIDDYSGTSISVPVVDKEILKMSGNWFALDEMDAPVDLVALLYMMMRLCMRPDYIGTVSEIADFARSNGFTTEEISTFIMVWTHEDTIDTEDYNNLELAMYYAGTDMIDKFSEAINELSFKYSVPIPYMLTRLMPHSDMMQDYFSPDTLPFLEVKDGGIVGASTVVETNLKRLMKTGKVIHPDFYDIMGIDSSMFESVGDDIVTEDTIKERTALPELIFAENVKILEASFDSIRRAKAEKAASEGELAQSMEHPDLPEGEVSIGVVNTDGPGGEVEITEEELAMLLGTTAEDEITSDAGGASNDSDSFRSDDGIGAEAKDSAEGNIIRATPKSNSSNTGTSTARAEGDVRNKHVDNEPIGTSMGDVLKASGIYTHESQETQEVQGEGPGGSAAGELREEEKEEETQESEGNESGGTVVSEQPQEAEQEADSGVSSEVNAGKSDQWQIAVRTVGVNR